MKSAQRVILVIVGCALGLGALWAVELFVEIVRDNG